MLYNVPPTMKSSEYSPRASPSGSVSILSSRRHRGKPTPNGRRQTEEIPCSTEEMSVCCLHATTDATLERTCLWLACSVALLRAGATHGSARRKLAPGNAMIHAVAAQSICTEYTNIGGFRPEVQLEADPFCRCRSYLMRLRFLHQDKATQPPAWKAGSFRGTYQ